MTIFLYTNENQKNIMRVLKLILRYVDDTDNDLIVIDDMSADSTVPKLVSIIGNRFMEEDKYKFHINLKKCGFEESLAKAKKIAKSDIIAVDNKITQKELEREIRNVANK